PWTKAKSFLMGSRCGFRIRSTRAAMALPYPVIVTACIELADFVERRDAMGLSPLAAATQPDSEQFRSSPRTLPIRPSKVRRSDIYLALGGVHGTETKTSYRIYRRDGSCDGVDHPGGHDVGGGCAELVIDLWPSTFAFVLRARPRPSCRRPPAPARR